MAKQATRPRRTRGADRTKHRIDEGDDYAREHSALTALDLVRGRLSEIDALAAAADDRIDAVPGRISDRDQRRRLGQLIELVVATAKATRAAVDEAEDLAAQVMAGAARSRWNNAR